jgi:hypothetical protein
MALSARERAILDFAECWWSLPGSKEQAIRSELDMSPARYYQLLGDLVDSPDALVAYPLVVRRLRRQRDERRRARWEGGPVRGSR